MTTFWRHFENYVEKILDKQYPDYIITTQPTLTSGMRPDFVLESTEKTGVIDAKEKLNLTKSDLNNLLDYMFELAADFGKIYVSVYTKISKKIREDASKSNIEIVRTNWDVCKYYSNNKEPKICLKLVFLEKKVSII